MAAAQFSDDAYNKNINDMPESAGTLIGNWFEERVLRDASGEGRTVPQRHLPRSGLLKDWTKVPSGGPRKMDNTFDRMYGPDAGVAHVPQSKLIGGGEYDIFGDRPIAPTLQAAGRVPRIGRKEIMAQKARFGASEEAVKQEEAIVDAVANERYFVTTTGLHFEKPPESESHKAELERKSCKLEILHGAPPDRKRALDNEGLEIPNHTHYTNMETLTQARMQMADPRERNDVQASAASGVNLFGRSYEFTKSIGDCLLGLSKDEELNTFFQGLKTTNPHRTLGGSQPRGAPFAGVPSLASLKEAIHKTLGEVWGPNGYVMLRQRCFDCADTEGFIRRSDATRVLREDLGLSTDAVNETALNVYLGHLITMKKEELHVGSLMSSLRPALSLKARKQVINYFEGMNPVEGNIRLGSWLQRVNDENLKVIVLTAFGAEGAAELVQDMPVTEAVFLELIADLGALTDVESLLA
jgi:hypothetical protein